MLLQGDCKMTARSFYSQAAILLRHSLKSSSYVIATKKQKSLEKEAAIRQKESQIKT